jgi:hypothetical protein
MERFALLWLLAGVTILVLALWKGLLSTLAHAAGITYLPSALFAVAFLFVLVMLVHFSMTISRLSDQNTILAQRLALLQQRLDRRGGGEPDEEALEADEPSLGEDAPFERRPSRGKSKGRPEGSSRAEA